MAAHHKTGYTRINPSSVTTDKLSTTEFRVFCYLSSKAPGWKFKIRQASRELGLSTWTLQRDFKTIKEKGLTMDDMSVKQYTAKGFVIIPNEILTDHNLSCSDLRVWAYIRSKVGIDNWDFSQRRIAAEIGLSKNTVCTSIQRLKKLGLITSWVDGRRQRYYAPCRV
jgi:predicted DNA-binding transcriptional regulator